jgi:hypothetical protein
MCRESEQLVLRKVGLSGWKVWGTGQSYSVSDSPCSSFSFFSSSCSSSPLLYPPLPPPYLILNLFLIIVVLGVCCDIYQIIVELIPSIILLYSPFPHSWNSFNMSHFSISIHEYIIFWPYSPSYTFSLHPPPSHWCQLSDSTCFTFLFSIFEKRHFYLNKTAIQGVSRWHFHVHMYYNPNWFTLSIFRLSTLVLFLWWFQQV